MEPAGVALGERVSLSARLLVLAAVATTVAVLVYLAVWYRSAHWLGRDYLFVISILAVPVVLAASPLIARRTGAFRITCLVVGTLLTGFAVVFAIFGVWVDLLAAAILFMTPFFARRSDARGG